MTIEPLKSDALTPDELVSLTIPHYNQLDKQGSMRDGEVISDKTLDKAQHPVLVDANYAVTFRLKQEHYRRLWQFKDRYRLDKWKHKDNVKDMKRTRKAQVKANRAARKEQRRADRAAKRAIKDLNALPASELLPAAAASPALQTPPQE